MKIGLVCPYIYPEAGGVAQHVRFLYENLRSQGHDVRVLTASHGPQRSSEGDIIRLGVGFSVPINASVGTLTFSPRYLSQINAMLEREQFDVLHFHEPFVPFLSLFLLRESHSVNIATFHAYAGFSPSYEFGSRALRGYAGRLHGRIAVSAAARHFIDRFFPGDYKVIPNGVDTRRFADAVPIARWQDGTPNVLFVGRHEPRKGLLDLLKAHRILRKTGSGSRLLIVGSGPQEREARRYVATRGLKAVEFLGRVSDAEKAQLFQTADVYASPAKGGESFGIVLLEAMAAGTPIVCSDIHGYKGVVRRGREGILVRPGEPRSLAVAIDRLLRDPALREQMGAAGLERAEQFSWPSVAARVEDYYGFVIRRLAANNALPDGFTAEIPQAPSPVRARSSGEGSTPVDAPGPGPGGGPADPDPDAVPVAAFDSASASRQDAAE
jgi:phosphatidyl-myo-inositol alpha-mannosyltransferase